MENLNTYTKFCPNVFVAKCPEQHERGEVIVLTTKYGQEHKNEVHNYLGKSRDGFYLYSVTRVDGFNAQERAKRKADKLNGYAANAEKRSTDAYNSRASQSELEFMRLGEPIKVGHHSERRHRKLFEKYDNKMRKSIEESDKAEQYQRRAEYWEAKAKDINLSMPESLEFYEFKLEEAKKKHQFYKDNPEAREHSFSLTYAKKAVNEMEKNLNLAVKLWGSDEEIAQINKEKEEAAKKKVSKKFDIDGWINEKGGFWFFGSDTEAFKQEYNKLKEGGFVEEGEKVTHIIAGLYIPVKNKDEFFRLMK